MDGNPHVFQPYTPRGCAAGASPAWVVPNGIDSCIVNVAREMNLPFDNSIALHVPFRQRIKQACNTADKSIQDHQLRCLSPAMRNLLWRAGAGQDTDGMPLVAEDGRLVYFGEFSNIQFDDGTHSYTRHGGYGGNFANTGTNPDHTASGKAHVILGNGQGPQGTQGYFVSENNVGGFG